MDGILNIYKEKGFTSHDVVAKMRGILKQRKIGHTGTLDPDAEGVLPICCGKATKLCDLLTDKDKEYEAVLHLGMVTDTLDTSGELLSQSRYHGDEKFLRETIMSFEGEMDQIPPMYSAIKINGKKLYELARKGEVVEREARRITIHSIGIQFIDLEKQQVGIYVRVSKGTYIRSLCDDIGKKLGCGACMGKLIRTRSGSFEMKDSIRLEELSDIILNGSLEQHITHINEVFAIPHILLKPEYDRLVMNGNEITTGMLSDNYVEASQKAFLRLSGNCICVYLSNQTFAAVYQCIEDENNGNIYRIYKMFL